jgi:hypothetical protein
MTRGECEDRFAELNAEVQQAIAARAAFLDAHMALFAEFPIGAEVVNVSTHERTKVTKHYRMHDGGLSVDCRFSNGDNTSHYVMHPYVLLEDMETRSARWIRALQGQAAQR